MAVGSARHTRRGLHTRLDHHTKAPSPLTAVGASTAGRQCVSDALLYILVVSAVFGFVDSRNLGCPGESGIELAGIEHGLRKPDWAARARGARLSCNDSKLE